MKKIILLILVSAFFFGCKEKTIKTDLKIIKDYRVSNISDTMSVFSCSNLNKEKNFGELKIIDNHPLKIRCIYHGKYGGETINLEISNHLKVIKANYIYDSYDTVGGHKEEYSITNVKLVLNKNPFMDSLHGFEGRFLMTGTLKIIPDSFFEFSRSEKFEYTGYFVCE